MFELIWILICAFDGIFIGILLTQLIIKLLGVKPIGRLLGVVLGLCGGIAYFAWVCKLSSLDVGNWALIPIFGPAVVGIILLLYSKTSNGES